MAGTHLPNDPELVQDGAEPWHLKIIWEFSHGWGPLV